MVKKLSLSVVFAILVSISGVRAQEVNYPETVKALFQKADLEISEGYGILRFAQKDTRDVFLKPRIAVPDIEEADLIRQMVMKAGGEADYQRASKLVLDDFRNGKTGRISLEMPPQGGDESERK